MISINQYGKCSIRFLSIDAMIFIWKSELKCIITHFNFDREALAPDFRALFDSVVDIAVVDQVNVLAFLVLAKRVDLSLGDLY